MSDVSATGTLARRSRTEPVVRRAPLVPLVAALSVLALVAGYSVRDEMYLVPDRGLGYALGIVGLALMTLLLFYSLRKRVRALQALGRIRYWFEIHMLLGILGPVAILFHANFQVRSTNAAVALLAMLVVAGSGFVGRFAYARVHRGLFGQRETLAEVAQRAEASRSSLHAALRASPEVEACVREFEERALVRSGSAFGAFARALSLAGRTRSTMRRARRLLRALPPGTLAVPADAVLRALRRHLALVRRVAEFGFYERVLSVWHALHVPLCVVLFTAAVVHVIAVNLF
jgi:hypothetical protein